MGKLTVDLLVLVLLCSPLAVASMKQVDCQSCLSQDLCTGSDKKVRFMCQFSLKSASSGSKKF